MDHLESCLRVTLREWIADSFTTCFFGFAIRNWMQIQQSLRHNCQTCFSSQASIKHGKAILSSKLFGKSYWAMLWWTTFELCLWVFFKIIDSLKAGLVAALFLNEQSIICVATVIDCHHISTQTRNWFEQVGLSLDWVLVEVLISIKCHVHTRTLELTSH